MGKTPFLSVSFEKYTLDNGLQVIFHVDHKLPIVHVNLLFHVGSKNEKTGQTGLAHLFEHLMFEGSKNAPGKYFSSIEKAGANSLEGGVNGTTGYDFTRYYATVPSGNLEYLLWLESDRLATLAQTLSQEKLDLQREVVRNERRQRYENVPYGRDGLLITENLHPAGHPYSWMPIGSHMDLISASLDEVRHFFQTYYTPNNLSLVIAGDFDPANAKQWVEKYFGTIPPGSSLERIKKWVPKLEEEKIIEVTDNVPQEKSYLVWSDPSFFEAGEAELDLSSLVLTRGLSSRLSKILVYQQQLCTDVTSSNFSNEISGFFVIEATARPSVSLNQIEKIIVEEINRLAKSGPTSQELERAKAQWEYSFLSNLETVGGKAELLNRYNLLLGDPGKLQEDILRYDRVTTSDLKEAVKKWLNRPHHLTLRFYPERSKRESMMEVDRSQVPALGVDKLFHVPAVKTTQLENGLQLFVIERPDLPKTELALITKTGTIADPVGKEGLSYLMISSMDKGTLSKNALEIQEGFSDLGTALEKSVEREYSSLSLGVLKQNLKKALDILSDVIMYPIFPESELDRERKQMLDTLDQASKNPRALASRIAPLLVFGNDHPYGRPKLGYSSTVREISQTDLIKFYGTYWKPNQSALIFAGDINLTEGVDLARRFFSKWQKGVIPQIPISSPVSSSPVNLYMVDRKESVQTIICQILPGPRRKIEDYDSLLLVNDVWGGSIASRLMQNLREKKGFSYGFSSRWVPYSLGGIWIAQGAVQTDKTKEALIELIKELQGISGQKPITEEEFDRIRINHLRGYSQRFESLSRVVDQVREVWVHDLPLSELQRQIEGIQNASLNSVNAVAQKYALPNQSLFLLVGDLTKLKPALEELYPGEIVWLDTEGRRGR